FLFAADSDRKKIAGIISTANNVLYADPEVQHGSERWIRTKWSSVQQYRDGLTIDAAGLPPTTAAIAKFVPSSVLRWMVPDKEDPYLKLLLTPPMFGVIAVRDRYDQEQSLRAGRIWQRAHLLATARQLAARPANEAVEMVDHERKLGPRTATCETTCRVDGRCDVAPHVHFLHGLCNTSSACQSATGSSGCRVLTCG